MRCTDIEELLSAYANGELARTRKEFVEAHISACPNCRTKLQDYADVRNHLMSLRETPSFANIKGTTMLVVKEIHVKKTAFNWLRPVLIGTPIIGVLIALIMLQPWNSTLSPQVVLAQTRDATASLQSYRISLEGITKGSNQEEFVIKAIIEFADPDRIHVEQTEGADLEEIFIGNKQYFRNTYPSIGSRIAANLYSSMLSREYTLSLLDSLKDIRKLPEETFDGTICLHYKGTFDYEQQLIESWRSQEETGLIISDETKEQMLQEVRYMPSPEIELRIGKNDRLVRQMNWNLSSDGGEVKLDFRFYDFNQPVIIEAPLDSEGNLLTGWTSTASEY
jgi:hypothetical protein